jgi:dethiobiotin synthetase
MSRGCFVTGTDTGVGKSVGAAAMVHALRARGLTVLPMKPIAAGAALREGEWINDDTAMLLAAAGAEPALARDVTPILLREAIAPHIAAAHEGREIALAPVMEAFERLAHRAGFVVVEGVGGFHVPLGPSLDTVDLARALALPVVMVVGMRLGCLNHALLTAQAVRAAGLTLAGWIANTIDPEMPVLEENVRALDERLQAPRLGWLPHESLPQPANLAGHLDVSVLMAGSGAK